MFEDHSVGEEGRLQDGIEKIENRLQSIEDAMRDLKGQVEQFHQMVTRLVEMMEVNQKMVLQEMRRINAKSSMVCESCGMNGDGLHNFGDCAICLNRMMLQETALVKGCQHAYWSVPYLSLPCSKFPIMCYIYIPTCFLFCTFLKG